MKELFDDLPTRKFRKGQILVYEGDPVETLYLIISGFVKVSNIHYSGNQRTIIIYAPGEIFPMVGFLSAQGTAQFFYECLTDVEAKAMRLSQFQQKVKGNIEMGEWLITYAYDINQQFVDRIDTLTAESARDKVISLISYLAKKTGIQKNSRVVLSIPLTSQAIADMCNLTRETASVQLIRLKKEGVISGRRYLSVDPVKLTKLLEA